jgi:ParB-like chromosome segregation protein Spo0J
MTVSMRQEALLVDFEVHPAAAVFPMLSDDELRDLAEDIKAHGLLHPIVLDADGVLIDGRNRLAACNLAGVTPTFETFDGDPLRLIISANINRREMRPGQKAMVLADLLANSAVQQKYGQVDGLAKAGGIAPSTLSRANTVRAFDDLAEQVRAGASLTDAHSAAIERKRRQKEKQEDAEKQLAYLAEQRRKAIEKLEAARSSIGPAVKVPPEPDLEVHFSRDAEGDVVTPEPAPKLGENLKREDAMLARMRHLKDEITNLAGEPILADAWFFEGHVLAVRSWASQVVAAVYGMVETHNAALNDEGLLRRVK